MPSPPSSSSPPSLFHLFRTMALSVGIFSFIFLPLLLSQANLTRGAAEKLIYEDGYTVTTVFDGDKSNIPVNPHSIQPQFPSSSSQFLLLDSVASAFYTLSLSSTLNENVIEKMVGGNGGSTYMDGGLDSASFNKPRSFAVDFKGNVYVADYHNRAVRMITKSGVTTIAGGISQKPGRADGPARNASFSNDFELTFVPGRCALMISDHGNRLIRQINLKAENCKAQSGSVLGTSPVWILGLTFSCLFGLIVGLVIRPYVIPNEGLKWKHCLTRLEREIMMFCSGTRSVIVNSAAFPIFWQLITLSLSQLSLMFRLTTVEYHANPKQSVQLPPLMDYNIVHNANAALSPVVYGDLNDLITFDEDPTFLETSASDVVEQEERKSGIGEVMNVDSMAETNLIRYSEQSASVCFAESTECSSSGLVKRRRNIGDLAASISSE